MCSIGIVATKVLGCHSQASCVAQSTALAESGLPELILERNTSGGLVRRYLHGPLGALSLTNASATFYYHQDPLNTVTDLTDAGGGAQWRYEYEAYGAPRTTTNVSGSAPESRLRFNGQYLDPETGSYHLRARQYDAGTGRFAGLDPVDNALTAPFDSAYGYASARPTVLTDPSGLDPSIGAAKLNCNQNAFLCVLVYNAGYREGDCPGSCVVRTLRKLDAIGITHKNLVDVATGKGKIVSRPNADPPGIYFISDGKPILLEAPGNPTCGFICKIGQAATIALGCHSQASCIAAAAMTLTPGSGICRIGRAALQAAKAAAAGRRGARLGKKLDFLFGRSKGDPLSVKRSVTMGNQLARIGIFDNAAGRAYVADHLKKVLADPSNIARVDNGRTVRESLLMGPNGADPPWVCWRLS